MSGVQIWMRCMPVGVWSATFICSCGSFVPAGLHVWWSHCSCNGTFATSSFSEYRKHCFFCELFFVGRLWLFTGLCLWLIDWLSRGLTSHSTQNRSFGDALALFSANLLASTELLFLLLLLLLLLLSIFIERTFAGCHKFAEGNSYTLNNNVFSLFPNVVRVMSGELCFDLTAWWCFCCHG